MPTGEIEIGNLVNRRETGDFIRARSRPGKKKKKKKEMETKKKEDEEKKKLRFE